LAEIENRKWETRKKGGPWGRSYELNFSLTIEEKYALLRAGVFNPRMIQERSLQMKQVKYLMLAVFVMGMFGCQGKVKQCNDLIGVINQNQEIKTKYGSLDATKAGPKDFIAMADDMDKLKGKIDGVKLKDEKLKGFAKEYQDMLGEVSKTMRELAKAMESKDQAALEKVLKDMTALQGKEGPIVGKINEYCQSK
jgi:hypothetical protein